MEGLIIERLGERHRKLKRMEELEHPARKPYLWIIGSSVSAIAVCAVIAVVIVSINRTSCRDANGWEIELEMARNAGLDVEALLQKGYYTEALEKVDSAMNALQQEIKRLKASVQDEETSYLLQAEEQQWEVLKAFRKKISEKMQ